MKKKIICSKNKKAETANWFFIGIIFVLALFVGLAIFNYSKDTIFTIWSSIKVKIESYQPDKYEYTPDQYVEESVANNVYSYIYVTGNADRKVTKVTDFDVGLGSSFAEFNKKVSSGCNPGSELPGALSRSGCYILVAENDSKGWGLGDDCASNLYRPGVDGSIILYNHPPMVVENKKQAKEDLKKNCVTGYHCQNDPLNLLYHFFAQKDEKTNVYFDKSLICASPRLGIYMWFKCDSEFANKSPDNKVEIYGETNKVQYECLCSGNSCSWSIYEEV